MHRLTTSRFTTTSPLETPRCCFILHFRGYQLRGAGAQSCVSICQHQEKWWQCNADAKINRSPSFGKELITALGQGQPPAWKFDALLKFGEFVWIRNRRFVGSGSGSICWRLVSHSCNLGMKALEIFPSWSQARKPISVGVPSPSWVRTLIDGVGSTLALEMGVLLT